jgi:hypothetical protein
MKRKIRIIDNINHEEHVSERELPNKEHLEVQLKTKANIFRDRKKYTRKIKHKKKY